MKFIQLFALLFLSYVVRCTASESTCGGFLSGKEGEITSAAENCTWTISEFSPEKYIVISVYFRRMWNDCVFESLRIFDKNGSDVGDLCNRRYEIIVLKDGNITVQFQSTYSSSRVQYPITFAWTRRDLAQCSPMIGKGKGGKIFQTTAEGAITNCSWMITTRPGYYIKYTFRTASVGWSSFAEPCHDLLRFHRFDGLKSFASTYGIPKLKPEYKCNFGALQDIEGWSYGNELVVHLSTYRLGNFSLNWKGIPPCGKYIVSKNGGKISVRGDQYMSLMNCPWKIKIEPGSYIDLTIDYDIEASYKCENDWIQIKEKGRKVKKFCGKGSDVMRLRYDVFVRFKSDSDNQGKGFTITWKMSKKGSDNEIVKNSACGSKYVPGNPLCWKTSPTQEKTCYIKVKVIGRQNAYVMAHSLRLDDSKDPTSDKEIYGIRGEKINDNSFACVEFKCSGTLVNINEPDDEGTVITPYIQVFVKEGNSCQRRKMNKLLERYISDHATITISDEIQKSNNTIFQMYSPRMEDPLGKSFGIFPNKETCDKSGFTAPAVIFNCK